MSKRSHASPPPGPPKSRRRLKQAVIALLLIGVAVCLARWDFITVVGLKNGEFVVMRYRFFDESADLPRLQLLRKREKLDQVIAPGKTQFEKFVLLRKWVHDQWKNQGRFYYPPWDALEILDLARQHQNYGFCGQYSIVFAQACLSLGLHARYINLGHFLTAVWSDEYNRWVVMDPTNDLHYERDGLPLRGRELADAAWHDQAQGIFAVGSDGSRTPVTGEGLRPWRNYAIIMRNNHLTKPVVVRRQGRLEPLVHQDDYRKYLLAGRDEVAWVAEALAWYPPDLPADKMDLSRPASGDPQDFRDVYNQTLIFLAAKDVKSGSVKLKLLAEHAPEFQSFLIDGQHEAPQDQIIFKLKPGLNTCSARVKTRFGWLGPESSIKIFYKPDWFARSDHRSAMELKLGLP